VRQLQPFLLVTLTFTGPAMAARIGVPDPRRDVPELFILGGVLIALSLCQRWLVRR
jgi:hypothetical protein